MATARSRVDLISVDINRYRSPVGEPEPIWGKIPVFVLLSLLPLKTQCNKNGEKTPDRLTCIKRRFESELIARKTMIYVERGTTKPGGNDADTTNQRISIARLLLNIPAQLGQVL